MLDSIYTIFFTSILSRLGNGKFLLTGANFSVLFYVVRKFQKYWQWLKKERSIFLLTMSKSERKPCTWLHAFFVPYFFLCMWAKINLLFFKLFFNEECFSTLKYNWHFCFLIICKNLPVLKRILKVSPEVIFFPAVFCVFLGEKETLKSSFSELSKNWKDYVSTSNLIAFRSFQLFPVTLLPTLFCSFSNTRAVKRKKKEQGIWLKCKKKKELHPQSFFFFGFIFFQKVKNGKNKFDRTRNCWTSDQPKTSCDSVWVPVVGKRNYLREESAFWVAFVSSERRRG